MNPSSHRSHRSRSKLVVLICVAVIVELHERATSKSKICLLSHTKSKAAVFKGGTIFFHVTVHFAAREAQTRATAIAAVMKTKRSTPPAAIAGPSLLLLLLFAAAPLLARRDRVGAAVVSRGC